MAATSFCSQEVELEEGGGRVRISKIFQWYGGDFGSSEREILKLVPRNVCGGTATKDGHFCDECVQSECPLRNVTTPSPLFCFFASEQ